MMRARLTMWVAYGRSARRLSDPQCNLRLNRIQTAAFDPRTGRPNWSLLARAGASIPNSSEPYQQPFDRSRSVSRLLSAGSVLRWCYGPQPFYRVMRPIASISSSTFYCWSSTFPEVNASTGIGIDPPWWLFRTLRGSCRHQNAPSQQVKAGLAVALPLQELDAVDLAFGLSAAPGLG